MATGIYGCLHFLVDGLCAWAMFARYIPGGGGYTAMLIYNFCAFALQMPLGILLDSAKRERAPFCWAVLGAALTVLGCVSHPAVLGLGNALFHTGGGVDVIREDWRGGKKGSLLGIFVAPGGLGLFLGTWLGKTRGDTAAPVILFALAMALLCLVGKGKIRVPRTAPPSAGGNGTLVLVSCFAVVVLRSFVGLAVSFPWKVGLGFGLSATLAVVLGKMAGGILAARFGPGRIAGCSLLLAAVCYLLSGSAFFGLTALFLFNMTMPITLYTLACRFPKLPGFSFGCLTFGLFLGFLPVYFGWNFPVSGPVLGALGSVLSLLLLWKAVKEHRILC